MFAENLSAFFQDFAVTAVANNLTAQVIFDAPDEDVLGQRVQSVGYTIVLPTGALGNLIYNTAVTVNGVAYKVRQASQIEDGALQRVSLEAVTAVVA